MDGKNRNHIPDSEYKITRYLDKARKLIEHILSDGQEPDTYTYLTSGKGLVDIAKWLWEIEMKK